MKWSSVPRFLSYLNNMLLFKILQELVSFFPWVTRKCESTQVRGTLRSLIQRCLISSFPRPDHSLTKPPGPNHQSCELTKLFSHLASRPVLRPCSLRQAAAAFEMPGSGPWSTAMWKLRPGKPSSPGVASAEKGAGAGGHFPTGLSC